MKTLKRISFIIPCYNSVKYLRECIDSLFNQDISEDSYEIIAVNDCSTDNTKEILSEYQRIHNNLIIVDHKSNKGQGGARNTGLEHAVGEYIWYIDHDDFILPNSLSFLLQLSELDQLDILQFNYDEINEQGGLIKKNEIGIVSTEIISGLEFVNSFSSNFLNAYNMSVWSRIYKRKFLIEGKFLFEEIGIFEDLEYSLRTLLYAKRFKFINKYSYSYRIHATSTMSIFQRTIKGDLTYFSCIRSGLNLVKLGNDLISKDIIVSRLIIEGGIWRINRMTKLLLLSTTHERRIFYSLLKNDKNRKDLYTLSSPFNNLLIRFPLISSMLLFFISPLLRKIKRYRFK